MKPQTDLFGDQRSAPAGPRPPAPSGVPVAAAMEGGTERYDDNHTPPALYNDDAEEASNTEVDDASTESPAVAETAPAAAPAGSPTTAPGVATYEATREWTTPANLCEPCAAARRADRWTLKLKGPFDGHCQDCEHQRQAAPDYKTPTVDFVLISDERMAQLAHWLGVRRAMRRPAVPDGSHLHSFEEQ